MDYCMLTVILPFNEKLFMWLGKSMSSDQRRWLQDKIANQKSMGLSYRQRLCCQSLPICTLLIDNSTFFLFRKYYENYNDFPFTFVE